MKVRKLALLAGIALVRYAGMEFASQGKIALHASAIASAIYLEMASGADGGIVWTLTITRRPAREILQRPQIIMTGFVLVRLLQTEGPIVSAPRPKFVTRIPVRARLSTEAGALGRCAETANQLILIVVIPEVLVVTQAQAVL